MCDRVDGTICNECAQHRMAATEKALDRTIAATKRRTQTMSAAKLTGMYKTPDESGPQCAVGESPVQAARRLIDTALAKVDEAHAALTTRPATT